MTSQGNLTWNSRSPVQSYEMNDNEFNISNINTVQAASSGHRALATTQPTDDIVRQCSLLMTSYDNAAY